LSIVQISLVVVCAISFYEHTKQRTFAKRDRKTKPGFKLAISQESPLTLQLDLRKFLGAATIILGRNA
jgi:hypothetical protein